MDDTIIMDSVIQKYFAGETSEQEEKYLLAWLEESEEHRKYFFELKSLWGARRVFEESTDLSRFASFMRSTCLRSSANASRSSMRAWRASTSTWLRVRRRIGCLSILIQTCSCAVFDGRFLFHRVPSPAGWLRRWLRGCHPPQA